MIGFVVINCTSRHRTTGYQKEGGRVKVQKRVESSLLDLYMAVWCERCVYIVYGVVFIPRYC